MRKVILVVSVVLVLLAVGCEPESMINAIADANNAMSDPNGSIQLTAENLQEMITTGMVLVKAVPGFPYAKFLLSAFAVAQTLLAIILGWRKHTTTKALKEVVWGNEILKKGTIDSEAFRKAQDTAQSESTVELVNKIRKNVA